MKEIYEIFNEIDVDENEFEEMYASEIEKEKVKKNIRQALNKEKLITKKRFINKKKISIAAAITLVCISSAIVVKPALATDIPIIGKLFEQNLISVNKQYADYIDAINKTKSCEGIEVTFESAAADDNKLFLSFIVKNNNKEIKDNYTDALLIPTAMKVNGKSVSTGAGASWEFIDNNTIKILKKINWSGDKIPNKMNIDISISSLFGKSGDWGVQFFLDKSKQAEKTYKEKINSKLEVNGVKGEISTVTISPLTVNIEGEGDFNDVTNEAYRGTYLQFIAFDDKGNGLSWGGSSGHRERFSNIYKWNSNFISNDDMKSVTIIPTYEIKAIQNTDKLTPIKLDMDNARAIDLPIDEDRSISIKDYFVEGDYLVIRYNQKYFGKDSFRHPMDIPMYVTVDGIEVKGADGDERDKLHSRYATRAHVGIFKIGTSRNIMVGTYDGSNVKLLKDKSVTVNTK